MSSLKLSGCVLAAALNMAVAQMAHAEPTPTIGPPQAWVRDTPIPAPNPANRELPLQFLLSSRQQRIGQDSSEIYVHSVAVPQTAAGLQALGNIAIPWNSERSDLTIHHATLRRGQQIIDLLKGQELVVLRRENNLENSTLDGVRTIVLQAPGLQVGDVMDLAFTQHERPGTIGAKVEAIVAITEQAPFALIERRFLIDESIKIDWKADPALGAIRKGKAGGLIELSYSQKDYVPAKVPANAPSRYRFPAIQLTSYASWQDVAGVMKPLFDSARKAEPASPLIAEAEAIAKAHTTAEARMLAALRLTQEKVRYVALALGEGTHIPATADQTWTRKFGDCKGKVAMLLALLDRLGIAATPMLTSGQAHELIGERLPSLYAFDHVVVKAQIGGRAYVLDPTNYGQRTLDELISPGFDWGLPLVDGASLIRLPKTVPSHPLTETEILWDANEGFDQQVPYTATLTYRGTMASWARTIQAAAPDRASLEGYFKKAMPRIDDDLLKVVAIDSEANQGEFTVRFSGKAPMEWESKTGLAGRQFQFGHSVPSWSVDFERAEGRWKDLPVVLSFPLWVRSKETVLLPANGAGFTLRGQPIDSIIAGTEIKRSMTMNGGRATAVADFRRTVSEISAAEARAADSVLDRIGDNLAYVVSPKDYVVSRAEVKTILGETAKEYDDFIRRARLLMDQSDRTRAIAELDKAIKIDDTRPEAPALQSINYRSISRRDEARAALAKALAIDPENWDVLRAQGFLAWHDRDSALAIKSISKAIEINADYDALYMMRAQIHAGMGRYEEALTDVRRAIQLSGNAISLGTVAQVEAASGKLEDALASLERAEKSGNSDLSFILVLRGDYQSQLGRTAEAKASYRAAKNETRKMMLKHNAAIAPAGMPVSEIDFQMLVMSRNFDEAEPIADQIVARQRYPSASNLSKRAWLRMMNGKYDGAIRDARAALDLDPTNEQAQLSLTVALLRTAKYAEANGQATKALTNDETNAMQLYARALARAKLGDQAGSAKDLNAARQMRFDVMLDPAFLGLKAS